MNSRANMCTVSHIMTISPEQSSENLYIKSNVFCIFFFLLLFLFCEGAVNFSICSIYQHITHLMILYEFMHALEPWGTFSDKYFFYWMQQPRFCTMIYVLANKLTVAHLQHKFIQCAHHR